MRKQSTRHPTRSPKRLEEVAPGLELRRNGARYELRGEVTSFRDKLAAEEVARRVADGAPVDNHVRVNHETNRADRPVASAVREALRRTDEKLAATVGVRVRCGRCVVFGTVSTPAERRRVARVAGTVPGSEGVTNLVRCDEKQHRLDRHAANAIRMRLRARPDIDWSRGHLAVAGNVAVLTGAVPSPGQRKRVEAVAGEFPLFRVRNELRIDGSSPGSEEGRA